MIDIKKILKHTSDLLTFSIFLAIVANWWAIISFSTSFGFTTAIKASNPIYQVVLIFSLLLSIKKRKPLFFISFFLFNLYVVCTFPTLGFESIKMLYYSLISQVNLQAFIYYLSTWLMLLISSLIIVLEIIKKIKYQWLQ